MTQTSNGKDFSDLLVWKKAHRLALDIYIISQGFPKEEMYGMTSQIRRAVVSVTCNIAEGFARYYFKEKIRFYYMARGSAAEVVNLLYLARDLGWVDEAACLQQVSNAQEVRQMLSGLIQSIECASNSY